MKAGLVTLAPEGSVLDVDAVALEEDTYLVLSADPNPRETREKPGEVLQQVSAIEPKPLGSVIISGSNPLQFLAIVHDLDREPSCREEWVASALREILRQSEERRIRRIALPMIGTVHGSLSHSRFIELFSQALSEFNPEHVSEICVVLPGGTDRKVVEQLRSLRAGLSPSDSS